jgi:glutathione S-transferase
VLTLPAAADGLTPAWLSQALGTEVVAVDVLDHAFATNQRVRVGLTYATPGAGPATLFGKLAPIDPAHRAMIDATGMGVREVQFFADVAPTVGLRVPQAHYAASADDGNFVLLLEDLTTAGCAFSNGEWGIDADAAASAVVDLARFHARFEDPAARAGVAPWLADDTPRRGDAITPLLRSVLDEHGDAVSATYAAVGGRYVEQWAAIDALWELGPPTLIHGDPHIGNVFLDGRRVGFLDWGLSRVSTPLRDVSYFLVMSVDPDDRRRAERDLWHTYLDARRAAGGAPVTFDDAWSAYRVHTAYTVLATFLAFMPSYATADGRALGGSLRSRCEQALADLDVLGALRDALRDTPG